MDWIVEITYIVQTQSYKSKVDILQNKDRSQIPGLSETHNNNGQKRDVTLL